MEFRLIALDMDGTLLDAAGRVPDSFWEVLAEARSRGIAVAPASGRQLATLRSMFTGDRDPGTFIAENGTKAPGFVKLVADSDTGQVLGLHMVGPYASEVIWGASVILETELSVADLRQVVIPHPTVSELIREAAWAIKA